MKIESYFHIDAISPCPLMLSVEPGIKLWQYCQVGEDKGKEGKKEGWKEKRFMNRKRRSEPTKEEKIVCGGVYMIYHRKSQNLGILGKERNVPELNPHQMLQFPLVFPRSCVIFCLKLTDECCWNPIRAGR